MKLKGGNTGKVFSREQFTTVWGLPGFHKFSNPLNDPIHQIGKDLHGRFLAEIPYQLINKYCFDRKRDLVLDPFGGTGTVMVEAYRLGFESVSIDIDEAMIACHNKKLEALQIEKPNGPKVHIHQCNSKCIPYDDKAFAILITSPPYPYAIKFNSSAVEDISNVKDYQKYLDTYKMFLIEFIRVMRPGGFICQVLSDVIDDSDLQNKRARPFISDITSIMVGLEQEYVRTITFPFIREVMRAQGSEGIKGTEATLGIVSDNILNKGWYIFADEKIVIFRKPGGDNLPIRFTASKKGKSEKFSFDELMLLWVSKADKVNRKRVITKMFPTRSEVALMLQVGRMKKKGWLINVKKMYADHNIRYDETEHQKRIEEVRSDIKKVKEQ